MHKADHGPEPMVPAQRKRRWVRGSVLGAMLVSLVVQILLVVDRWLQFDPRLSCHRLTGWSEWLDCMHGRSHLHVTMLEYAAGAWIIALVAALCGRFFRPWMSLLIPLAVAAFTAWIAFGIWTEEVVPYAPFGEPEFSAMINFAFVVVLNTIYLLVPVVAAWVLGVRMRPAKLV